MIHTEVLGATVLSASSGWCADAINARVPVVTGHLHVAQRHLDACHMQTFIRARLLHRGSAASVGASVIVA